MFHFVFLFCVLRLHGASTLQMPSTLIWQLLGTSTTACCLLSGRCSHQSTCWALSGFNHQKSVFAFLFVWSVVINADRDLRVASQNLFRFRLVCELWIVYSSQWYLVLPLHIHSYHCEQTTHIAPPTFGPWRTLFSWICAVVVSIKRNNVDFLSIQILNYSFK